MKLKNTPAVKMGVVAVSRDCFPIELSKARLRNVVAECKKLKVKIVPCKTIIESEADAMAAVDEMKAAGVNAVAVYLGNFGPEGPTTIFAEKLGVPFMLCAAAEESVNSLVDGRGDAYCGMLNASINTGLRNLRPHIPQMPVGLPAQIAEMIAHFNDVARVVVGIKNLKTFSFGPRPQDFYACNAPIKPLYDLGIEVMENSELDMYVLYNSVADERRKINAIARDMAKELGVGNNHPEKLQQLAQFELALVKFFEENLGSRQFGVFANKCWPSFEAAFGFVPCFVNSRLAGRGIPAACEVDIYGAVSEYIAQLASLHPATLLDINNTVPADLKIKDLKGASRADLFMGFHCGIELYEYLFNEVPAHHAPPDGAGAGAGHHVRHARRHAAAQCGDGLPPAGDRRLPPAELRRRGAYARRRSAFVRQHRHLRHPEFRSILPPRPHREAVPAPRGHRLQARRQDARRRRAPAGR